MSEAVKITVRPNGPLRVEGEILLVDADGKQWDLTLRDGLAFHDGTPVLARDCVATIERCGKRYPFVATSLYNAFVQSKQIALQKLFNLRAVRYMTPFLMREIDDIWEVFDGDPWPYGVEPNRPTLEALVVYLQDLGLISAPVKVDDLFVPTYG